ncbi:MAG: preprotein translocase subunit SecE [Caldisericaceae bacterium]
MKDKAKNVQKHQQVVKTNRGSFVDFLKGVWFELTQRVKWPTRKELTQYTIVVVAFIVFWAAYIGLWDFIFAKGVELITK